MNHTCCTGPVSRRDFLQVGSLALGGLALGGLALSDLLAARSVAGTSNADTSVIMLYLHGGPSQLETYDLKPQAPVEYRSVFQPIATNVPGMEICESQWGSWGHKLPVTLGAKYEHVFCQVLLLR